MIRIQTELVCGLVYFFFFQAEDGIRDSPVTGVQTCALPISFSSSDNTFGVEESTNSDSDKILSEAAAVAESQTGDKFPDMPMMDQMNIPSSSTESKFM